MMAVGAGAARRAQARADPASRVELLSRRPAMTCSWRASRRASLVRSMTCGVLLVREPSGSPPSSRRGTRPRDAAGELRVPMSASSPGPVDRLTCLVPERRDERGVSPLEAKCTRRHCAAEPSTGRLRVERNAQLVPRHRGKGSCRAGARRRASHRIGAIDGARLDEVPEVPQPVHVGADARLGVPSRGARLDDERWPVARPGGEGAPGWSDRGLRHDARPPDGAAGPASRRISSRGASCRQAGADSGPEPTTSP